MTTPDPSAVRAWARDNGYTISDRGRVPAEVREAYLAAQAKKAPAKKAAAPAKKAAPAKAAPAKAVKVAPAKPEPVDDEPATEPGSAPLTNPQKQQSGAPEDRRLIALAEQIQALTARVEKLEKAAGSEKPSRFRRKSR